MTVTRLLVTTCIVFSAITLIVWILPTVRIWFKIRKMKIRFNMRSSDPIGLVENALEATVFHRRFDDALVKIKEAMNLMLEQDITEDMFVERILPKFVGVLSNASKFWGNRESLTLIKTLCRYLNCPGLRF